MGKAKGFFDFLSFLLLFPQVTGIHLYLNSDLVAVVQSNVISLYNFIYMLSNNSLQRWWNTGGNTEKDNQYDLKADIRITIAD